MGCGCRKKSGPMDGRVQNVGSVNQAQGSYEVWLNGVFTNRAFISLGSAQAYANRIGGSVRQASA